MGFSDLTLQEIPQAVLLAEIETGEIVFANRYAEFLLGLPKEKIIGLRLSELLPVQKEIDFKEIFKEDISKKMYDSLNRKTYKKNLNLKHSSGKLISIDVFFKTFNVDDKRYIIGLFVDNTKRTKLEKKNRLLNGILLKVEEMFQKGSFKCIKKSEQTYYILSNGAKRVLELKKNIVTMKDLTQLLIEEQKNDFINFFTKKEENHQKLIRKFIFFINNKYRLIQIQKFSLHQDECFGIINDITDEHTFQEKLRSKEIYLKMLSECHKALFYAQEEIALLNQICKIIVETGKYLMCWIGYKKYDAEKNIEIVSYYCKSKELEEYIKNLKLNWREDNPFGLGPAGVSCREGKIDIEKDLYYSERFKPIQKLIVKYNLQSVISIPILFYNRVIAVLLVYSEYANAFKEEEVDILKELAINLGLGINLLRERKSKLNLLEQNILLTKVLDNTNVAIIIVGKEGKILYLNRKFEDISGYLLDEIIGQNINILKSGLHEPEFYQEIWRTLLNKKDWKGEIINKRKDGSLFLSKVFISPILNSLGEISHYIQILEDITLEKYYEEELEKTKFYDSITKLPNKNFFIEKLNQYVLLSETFYLLLIDIDNFSKIVHEIGFENSDTLLFEFAKSLSDFIKTEISENILKKETILARIGGDEFGLLLSDSNINSVVEFCKQITEKLRKNYLIKNREFVLSVSIGIAIYPEDAKTPDEVLRIAEIALKKTKEENGAGSYGFLSKEIEKEITEQSKIENQLQTSIYYLQTKEKSKILKSGFYLEYQPIYNLFTNQIISLEALIRWKNPKLGMIPPAKFIPIAEKSKLIVNLGEFIIEEVCKQIISWIEEGVPIVPIAINVSYFQLKQKKFIYFLKSIIREYKIDPSFIEFEITENVILRDEINTKEIFEELKNLQIKLLIDDFGSGYSSLSYLLKYKFDIIKIDQVFIKMLSNNHSQDNNALKIIRSVVQIAKNLELKTIAEGIENQEQKYILLKEGCEFGQGFYLSVPKKPEEIKELLLANKKT
ncbi:MAG: EAL domain-containing protein [Leptonema sp. (in: bacteria)]